MAFVQDFLKFLKFVVLLAILATTYAQNCGIPEFQNPLTISTSPGFLSGAIEHVGNQECTTSGICLRIPSICPNSSCCVSSLPNNFPANLSLPASLSQSKCGCWDSVRKSCNPVSNFLIGYSTCDSENGAQIQSKTHISRGPTEIMSKFCETNTAVVGLVAAENRRGAILQIKTSACTPQLGGLERLTPLAELNPSLYALDVDLNNLIPAAALEGRDMQKTLRAFLDAKYKISTNSTYVSSQVDEKYVALQCAATSENNFFAISSNFLSGTIHNFLGQNGGACSGQGTCQISKSKCPSTGCCLVSTSVDENSSGASCECLGIGENRANACLLHHKIYKVSSTACTETGERVQRSLSVRIPSNGLNRCISGGDSWEMGSTKFETNYNGNLEAIIEVRKCILSAGNQEYLEIEEIVKAELSLDIISKILKQIE